MREILFRGKTEDGKWVEGHYIVLQRKDIIKSRMYTGYAEIDVDEWFPEWSEVIPETVGQYTGLKDKNGKKIFEGDIVENYAVYGLVIFEDGMFTLDKSANVNFGGHKQPLCYFDAIEVTGNIHDNKEIWEVPT